MATSMHPTAIVDPGAELGEGVEIGPYTVVGPGVRLGPRCKLWHHCSVLGDTTLGEDCVAYPFACIGSESQDLKYKGGRVGVRIGARNRFREYVSINAGSEDGEYTTLGDDNYLLAYCHVGHGCRIGRHLVASNGAALAGHVVVEDYVGIGGGGVAVHQFCRLGERSFIGGCSKVEQDVPPFMLADGNPARIRSYNKVGLRRQGFDDAQFAAVKAIFRAFYREGLNRNQAIERVRSGPHADAPEAVRFLAFAESGTRGLTGPAR